MMVMVTGDGDDDSDSNGPQAAEVPIEENWTHLNNLSPSSVEYNAMPWSQNCVVPEEHMGTGLQVLFFFTFWVPISRQSRRSSIAIANHDRRS